MEKNMTDKSLIVGRNVYEDVTETAHFPVQLSYAGHRVELEDVYFDDPETGARRTTRPRARRQR